MNSRRKQHRPIVVRSRLVPRRFCVNLFGTLWMRDPSWINATLINHERIHTAQMRELLFIPFYIIYVLEWLVRLLIERDFDRAYRSISFEREAYANGSDPGYLSRRRHFSQWRGSGWCLKNEGCSHEYPSPFTHST